MKVKNIVAVLRRSAISGFVLLCFNAFVTAQSSTPPSTTPTQSSASATPSTDCTQLPAIQQRLRRAEAALQDWAQLARYRESDAQLPAPDAGRIVFMGDSITDAWSNPKYGGFFPGKPYVNRGISGQTTPQMLVRFRPDVIDLKPRAVVILAGTNDIAHNTGPTTLAEIEGNLASMAELAKAHNIRVVLASVLPVHDYGRTRDSRPLIVSDRRPPEKIRALNEWIKSYAAQQGFVYLDYFSAMVDDKGFLKKELSDDGLHPNARGYVVMQPLAEAAIQTALRRR